MRHVYILIFLLVGIAYRNYYRLPNYNEMYQLKIVSPTGTSISKSGSLVEDWFVKNGCEIENLEENILELEKKDKCLITSNWKSDYGLPMDKLLESHRKLIQSIFITDGPSTELYEEALRVLHTRTSHVTTGDIYFMFASFYTAEKHMTLLYLHTKLQEGTIQTRMGIQCFYVI